MEKRTETGLVMGHAYGVTAVKKVTSTFYHIVGHHHHHHLLKCYLS